MFRFINKYGKGNVIQIARIFVPVDHVVCGRAFWIGFFRPLSNHLFWRRQFRNYIGYEGHLFFKKCSKFNVDFKNQENDSDKVFCFWDNSIWIGSVKLPILRRENLSSVVNVSTNSPKIFHRTTVDFFRLNYVESDQ